MSQVQVIEKDELSEHALAPIDLYYHLLKLAEDAEDIRASDRAMRELAAGQNGLAELALLKS